MANSDNAKGFVPVAYLNGAVYTGQANRYFMPATDSTAAYIGAPVKLAGSADSEGVPTVTAASSTDVVVGVIVGVESATRDSNIYREASTARYVYVADDPQTVFEIQEDSLVSTLAATNVGQNANWSGSGGSTTTGYSSVELDSDSANTTSTLDMQILRLARRADNEIGANAKWLVKLNNHQFVDGTTGI